MPQVRVDDSGLVIAFPDPHSARVVWATRRSEVINTTVLTNWLQFSHVLPSLRVPILTDADDSFTDDTS